MNYDSRQFLVVIIVAVATLIPGLYISFALALGPELLALWVVSTLLWGIGAVVGLWEGYRGIASMKGQTQHHQST